MTGAEKNLTVLFNTAFIKLTKASHKITSVTIKNKVTSQVIVIYPKIVIDATELGDVMAAAKVPYDMGMEAGSITGENVGVTKSNNIVQDITYVAILKDYGPGADCTIVKPNNYRPVEFDGANTDYYHSKRKAPNVDSKKMLEYGKLPNEKYMLNWPNYGNDIYLNLIEMTEAQREKELVKAKEQTYRFIYFIQNQLGYKHLGLANDEFPTTDRLALIPYHRESRRVKGLVRFTMRHIAEPFTYGDPLYRTGISVGDYPIDHHHKKNLNAPQHLEFYAVPSFNVPLGTLIPLQSENLIIAEKSISVSNVANGTTRLQPCVLLTGQAAGVLAGLSIKQSLHPRQVPVRLVQQTLLDAKAYLMPYIDVKPTHMHFEAIQKIGATGILRGKGVPYKWANQTWFYPDSTISTAEFLRGYEAFDKSDFANRSGSLSIANAISIIEKNAHRKTFNGDERVNNEGSLTDYVKRQWAEWQLENFDEKRSITRTELAVLLDKLLDPFGRKPINHKGYFLNTNN
jgi:hypothetical protein